MKEAGDLCQGHIKDGLENSAQRFNLVEKRLSDSCKSGYVDECSNEGLTSSALCSQSLGLGLPCRD